MEAVNAKNASLPKYLLVILDRDVIDDYENIDEFDAYKAVGVLTTWIVHQMNNVVPHKQLDLWEKKPGALSGFATNIIFVKMIRRIGKFNPESRNHTVFFPQTQVQ